MRKTNIYAGRNGWFYEIWIAERLVVVGWCATRERAALEALTA